MEEIDEFPISYLQHLKKWPLLCSFPYTLKMRRTLLLSLFENLFAYIFVYIFSIIRFLLTLYILLYLSTFLFFLYSNIDTNYLFQKYSSGILVLYNAERLTLSIFSFILRTIVLTFVNDVRHILHIFIYRAFPICF